MIVCASARRINLCSPVDFLSNKIRNSRAEQSRPWNNTIFAANLGFHFCPKRTVPCLDFRVVKGPGPFKNYVTYSYPVTCCVENFCLSYITFENPEKLAQSFWIFRLISPLPLPPILFRNLTNIPKNYWYKSFWNRGTQLLGGDCNRNRGNAKPHKKQYHWV